MSKPGLPRVSDAAALAIFAGVIFALAEVTASALGNHSPWLPLRMFASVMIGKTALVGPAGPVSVFIGVLVHLVLSVGLGLLFDPIAARCSVATRASYGRMAGIGLGFGALVWLVNFQLVARLFYPWFLATPIATQLLLHAVFFGLPLALMYSTVERRSEAEPQQPADAR